MQKQKHQNSARMPMDNKINISESLTTHAVWQNAIRCDPLDKKLFPEGDLQARRKRPALNIADLLSRPGQPTCTKCGGSGHLTYQCRNFLTIRDGKVVTAAKAEAEEKAKKGEKGGSDEKKEHKHKHRHHHRHREDVKKDLNKEGPAEGRKRSREIEKRVRPLG